MKKYGTRFLACFMACVIAFNVIAIPKAKAVATEAVAVGFSPAILALYMKSAGLSLTATSSAAGAAAMAEMVGGYAAATGTTASAVSSSIAAGAAISTSGAIILGVAAVSLLAAIVAWAISEYKLEPGTVPTQIYSGVTEAQMADGSFVSVYDGDTPPETMPVDAFIDNGKYYLYDGSYVELYGQYQYFYDSTGSRLKSANRSVGGVALGVYTSSFGPYPCLLWYGVDGQFLDKSTLMYGTTPISALYGPDAVASLSVSLPSDYEAAPEVLETQQMVIDVGAGEGATEEVIYNTVFDGIADGTLTSTYEISDIDTGTDTEPDVGVDADTELGFLERIANGIDALADKITEGFAKIFAPDPALMQDISDTFNSKFGFVSTLHQLGSDLLSIDATSAPPVVYIHLEDAEGSIYYGETVKALDMTWYARYKEDVDRIMSGFLWLGFLWLLFKRASAIIQGAEMATDYGVDVHDGYRIRGERNGKRF